MSQIETWYFSYGSNLSKQQMLSRTGSVPVSRNAWLANYALAFRRILRGDNVYATIVPSQGAIVHGVAYRCTPHAMAQLDLYEGVAENCYRRETVQASTLDGSVIDCIVYIGEAFSTEASLPKTNYLGLILKGAEDH